MGSIAFIGVVVNVFLNCGLESIQYTSQHSDFFISNSITVETHLRWIKQCLWEHAAIRHDRLCLERAYSCLQGAYAFSGVFEAKLKL